MPIVSKSLRALAIGVLVLGVAAGPALAKTAPKHPNFTGTWVMDTTKFEKTDARLGGLVFHVIQKPDTLRVTTDTVDDGNTSTFSATYFLNGSPRQNPLPDGSGTSTATLAWEDATLVLGTLFDVQGREYQMIQRWTLDASRKTLTEERSAESGGRKMTQKFVFTRR